MFPPYFAGFLPLQALENSYTIQYRCPVVCGLWKAFTVITTCSVCQTYLAKQLLCCMTKTLQEAIFLCSKTRSIAQHSAQTKVRSMHIQSYTSRQNLHHLHRNWKGIMNTPVIQHKSTPVIARLQCTCCILSFPFQSVAAFKIHGCRAATVASTLV